MPFIKTSREALLAALAETNKVYKDNLLFDEGFARIGDVSKENWKPIYHHLFSLIGDEMFDYFDVYLQAKDVNGAGADTGYTGRRLVTTYGRSEAVFLKKLKRIDPDAKIT